MGSVELVEKVSTQISLNKEFYLFLICQKPQRNSLPSWWILYSAVRSYLSLVTLEKAVRAADLCGMDFSNLNCCQMSIQWDTWHLVTVKSSRLL